VKLADLDDARPVGGGDICDAYRATWRGRPVFAKTLADPPPGFFPAEQHGLAWLGAAGAPVPEVLAVDDALLVLEWIDPGRPTRAAAERFGADLAGLHASPADAYGAAWPGYIGSLPLDNTPRPDGDWPAFFAEQRLLPYLRRAVDAGAVDDGGRRAVEAVCARLPELAGPPEPPAHVHGDLWSGNVHWAADGRVRLLDPAAHGGHRESDLALLELFGCPQLDVVLGAYQERFPLAAGWPERRPLHQLHPLLVHAALFGASYGARVTAVAGAVLRGRAGTR
jgi:fructosamine-3-kinase